MRRLLPVQNEVRELCIDIRPIRLRAGEGTISRSFMGQEQKTEKKLFSQFILNSSHETDGDSRTSRPPLLC